MTTSLYLPAPGFGLCWYEDSEDENVFVLMPGGGGSGKTGVKNQIMISEIDQAGAQVKLTNGFLTDSESRNNFVSGISSGSLLGADVVCALVANKCVLYEAWRKDDKSLSFKQRVEVETPVIEGEESDLNCSLVTKSGLLVAAGDRKVVHVWDIAVTDKDDHWEGEELFTLKHHQGAVAALCEHPFSNWMCSAGKDGACKIWNLTNGQLLLDIPALVDGVLNPHAKLTWEAKGCAFNADGTSLYSMQCTRRGPTYLIRWDLETKVLEDHADQAQKKVALTATPGKVRYLTKFAASKLAISSDGSLIAVGASDGRLIVCDSAQLNVVHDVLCHDFPITGVGFAPSRLAEQADLKAILATCSADRKFNVIRVGKKSFVYRLLQAFFLIMVIAIIIVMGLANVVFLENVVMVWKKVTGQQEL